MDRYLSQPLARLLTAFLLTFSFSQAALSQDFSVRTNVLWDAVSEPNIGLEFPLSDNWSIGGNAALKSWPRWLAWDWDKENPHIWRNYAIVPEVRYYLDQVYKGVFFGADAIYTHFNVSSVPTPFHMYPVVEESRVQGSYWAGGIFAGYAWWPWQHWRLELEAGAAIGLAAYDRYDCKHCGTKVGEERVPGIVPKLALNVAYNPVARDKRKSRSQGSYVISGTDTITVMTPPVVFTVHLQDVAHPETEGDRVAKEDSWVIPIGKYRPLDYLTRPGIDSIQYVRFPVDSWELNTSDPSNARVLERLTGAINRIKQDEATDEILISIVGLASIEGPQERNDTLSLRRAKVVANYLNRETGVSRRFFETIGKGEAWDWFRAQLEAQPDGREKLLDILYNEPDPDRREALIRADSRLYEDVKENFLADQRNSGYIRIYYGNAPDPVTEEYNKEVIPLLKAKRYSEAVKKLEASPDLKKRALQDAEAANAYGIALYFTALDNKDADREKEAIQMIESAARGGSEAAAENLEGIETYGPARKEFEAWQQIMKEEKL